MTETQINEIAALAYARSIGMMWADRNKGYRGRMKADMDGLMQECAVRQGANR